MLELYYKLWEIYLHSFFRHLFLFTLKRNFLRTIISIFFSSIHISLLTMFAILIDNYKLVNLAIHFLIFVLMFLLISIFILNDSIRVSFEKEGINYKSFPCITNKNRLCERFLLFYLQLKRLNISKEDVENLIQSELYKKEISYQNKTIVDFIKANPINSLIFALILAIVSGISSSCPKIFTIILFFLFVILIVSLYFSSYFPYLYIPYSEKIKEFDRFLTWYVYMTEEGKNNDE